MTGFRAAGSEKEFVIPGRAQREPRNDVVAPRNATDCFTTRKNGKCAYREGAATTGTSLLLALPFGGAAFLLRI
jgi:hypothetical protein